ncbi:MAG: hypothetical protein FJW39_27175 [Acidobacteria bacterium]|nr:hypothetical protein [Acidobacteriota bacterium]
MDFDSCCSRLEEHITRNYGIRIVTRNIPDPLTADLDGAEIHIDHEADPELRLFLLVHLFGHTVQWNASPRAFALGIEHTPPVPGDLLEEVIRYEREAAGYGLAVLREAGILDLDQWLSDFTACDMAYLANYYRTGRKGSFRDFWADGTDLLLASTIPDFTPARRVFRMDGIVI